MKITGNRPPRTPELSSGKARDAEQRPDRPREGAREGTQPAGNRTSLTMQRIREVIRNTPDIRADRVEAVRERIRNGEYKVDAERLAHNLLTESVRDDVDKP